MVEQGKYADVRGIQTHYHEDGQGEPLLLIHGSGPGVSAWANWRLVFPILSEKYHLYVDAFAIKGSTNRLIKVRVTTNLIFIKDLQIFTFSAIAVHVSHFKPRFFYFLFWTSEFQGSKP